MIQNKRESQAMSDLELMALGALASLGANAYGVTMRRELSARTGRDVSIGEVYVTMERLEKRGLISSRDGEGTPERGGRPKRFFKIEPPGIEALQYEDYQGSL